MTIASYRDEDEGSITTMVGSPPCTLALERSVDDQFSRVDMDLHKVTFPTFDLKLKGIFKCITELWVSRSMPRLSVRLIDLCSAEKCDDPEEQFIRVLPYYLTGWHIKPQSVKKP